MGMMASQITSFTIVYSTVYSGADQRRHQSSVSLAFVLGINRWPAQGFNGFWVILLPMSVRYFLNDNHFPRLTHCGLVMLFGYTVRVNMGTGVVVWWLQAITWNDVDLSVLSILRAVSQVCMKLNCNMCLMITLPGTNELTHWGRDKWPPFLRLHFQMHFSE